MKVLLHSIYFFKQSIFFRYNKISLWFALKFLTLCHLISIQPSVHNWFLSPPIVLYLCTMYTTFLIFSHTQFIILITAIAFFSHLVISAICRSLIWLYSSKKYENVRCFPKLPQFVGVLDMSRLLSSYLHMWYNIRSPASYSCKWWMRALINNVLLPFCWLGLLLFNTQRSSNLFILSNALLLT